MVGLRFRPVGLRFRQQGLRSSVFVFGSSFSTHPVVQMADNTIHQINHYPADSVICFVNFYPLDSDLSGG